MLKIINILLILVILYIIINTINTNTKPNIPIIKNFKSLSSYTRSSLTNKVALLIPIYERDYHYLNGIFTDILNNLDKVKFDIIFILTYKKDVQMFNEEIKKYTGINPNKLEDVCLYFNLMEGTLGNVKPIGDIFHEGEPIQLISAIMNHSEISNEVFNTKKNRDEALQILIQYYQLHIPQFKNLKTLDVIREILYS